jgi:uncharacterized membrane protein
MSALLSSITASLIAAAQPFANVYAASVPLQTGTAFLHFAGLLTGGGFAIASDRAVWRVTRSVDIGERRRLLYELEAVHRPVLVGLIVVFVTGFMLTLADVQTYVTSPTFWTKMGLVALLLTNGAWLGQIAKSLNAKPDPANRQWRLLLASSAASLTLWLAVTLAGVVLTNS